MPTVRMPRSRAARAITGAAPVPVPPPMPAATKSICAPSRCSRISSRLSSADCSPTSGRMPAPRPWVMPEPICTLRGEDDSASACASVLATTKSTPSSPAAIILLTAFPPAPPTPITTIRGLSSTDCGSVKLIDMTAPNYGQRNVKFDFGVKGLMAC